MPTKDPEWEDLDWLGELAEQGAHVLHVDTRTIGKVVEFWDGVTEVYVGPNGKGMNCPVVALDRGHTLVAKKGSLVRLEAAEAVFFAEAQGSLAQSVRAIAARGGELAVKPEGGMLILAAVLREQLSQVERLFQPQGGGIREYTVKKFFVRRDSDPEQFLVEVLVPDGESDDVPEWGPFGEAWALDSDDDPELYAAEFGGTVVLFDDSLRSA